MNAQAVVTTTPIFISKIEVVNTISILLMNAQAVVITTPVVIITV